LNYRVRVTKNAELAFKAISDKRIQQKIFERMVQLGTEPEKQGKALIGDLAGYRSVRVVGQRYRIIYRIDQDEIVVTVVQLGIRKDSDKKDVYTLAKKLLKARLLEQL
jgi:mRNA interferase RelE/StbE